MIIHFFVLRGLFIIPLLIIGGITSYTDIKYGKIKNIHLLWSFCYIIFLYLFLALYSYFILHQFDNLKYLGLLLLNGLLTFVFGYLLWYFNFWAAGDAKISIIYSLLIPLEFYSKHYIQYFPFAIFLFNTLLFISIFVLFKIFWQIVRKCLNKQITLFSFIYYLSRVNYKEIYKKIQTYVIKTGKLVLIMVSLVIIIQYLRVKVGFINSATIFNSFLIYLVLFVSQILILKTFLDKKIINIFIILAGLLCSFGFILSNTINILLNIIKNSLFVMLFVWAAIQLIYFYIENYEIKKIKVRDLRVGDFLASKSVFEINQLTRGQIQMGKYFIGGDGLNETQVQIIRDLFKNNETKELYVYQVISFAPFMFFVLLLFLVTKFSFL